MVKPANPFQKIQCPYCRKEFHPGECRIVTTTPLRDINGIVVQPEGAELKPASPGFFSRFFVQPVTGKAYARTGAARVCPYCVQELPYDTVPTYTIAIVGDGYSGKSHYIASCIKQLKEFSAQQIIGCTSILGQGRTETNFNNNYYAPIYMNQQKIPPTRQNVMVEPLIYELIFPGKSVNLLFYDSSGEDFVDPQNIRQYSHYILNASAIIFLADPMAMDDMLRVMPDEVKKKQPPRTLTPDQVIGRVIKTFQEGHGMSSGSTVKIPIAMTMSKSDLLEFVDRNVKTPLYLQDAVYADGLDIRQFATIDSQVRELLTRYGGRVLLNSSTLFERVSFFAVSPTGWPADEYDKYPRLQPRRCLDPLLWVLWQLGIIEGYGAQRRATYTTY